MHRKNKVMHTACRYMHNENRYAQSMSFSLVFQPQTIHTYINLHIIGLFRNFNLKIKLNARMKTRNMV